MEFDEYQKKARLTEFYPKEVEPWVYISIALGGEVGEVLNKLKKIMRDENFEVSKEKKEDLSYELGDILWYLSALCGQLGLSLDVVAKRNIDKLKSREERGKLAGSGDKR